MAFNMVYIHDTDDTPAPVAAKERPAFIGCYVRQETKDALRREAQQAPGGARDLTWLLNRILENYVAERIDTNGQES